MPCIVSGKVAWKGAAQRKPIAAEQNISCSNTATINAAAVCQVRTAPR